MNGARVVGEGLWSYVEEGIISIVFLLIYRYYTETLKKNIKSK